ncbi:MAG: hypothetical protein LBP75_00990 [Planctomycetota bacterium]|jgi:hypothetical protein|nr:hypothetical protein [Planctomycetota bacterium]
MNIIPKLTVWAFAGMAAGGAVFADDLTAREQAVVAAEQRLAEKEKQLAEQEASLKAREKSVAASEVVESVEVGSVSPVTVYEPVIIERSAPVIIREGYPVYTPLYSRPRSNFSIDLGFIFGGNNHGWRNDRHYPPPRHYGGHRGPGHHRGR